VVVAGTEQHTLPLRTLEQAVIVRNQILRWFQRAAQEHDAARRRRALTFTIVGGGPTGVEFAGALAELIRGSFRKDYAHWTSARCGDPVEAMGTLLPGLPQRLRAYAAARLRRMGVEVRLQAVVQQVTRDAVHLRDGTTVPTDTVV
jgi:NADH dehydrogenase